MQAAMQTQMAAASTHPAAAAASGAPEHGTAREAEPRPQTQREEMANAASHALGIALAWLAWRALTDTDELRGPSAPQFAAGLFCAAMAFQYAASAACHTWTLGRVGNLLRAVDHAAIFILIAGTVTPFLLLGGGASSDRGGAGADALARCALVWSLALTGAALKLGDKLVERRVSTVAYLFFGAVALAAAWPMLSALQGTVLLWLALGIGAYLVGTGFFLTDSALRYGHFVWHLFVLAGSACHVAAVAAAPWGAGPAPLG
jgi:hemolysin III